MPRLSRLQLPLSEDITEKRRHRRLRVILAGKLAFGAILADCTIRDLSPTGALVLAPTVPGLPDLLFLLILREGIVVRARRIWSRAPVFGLRFLEARDVATGCYPQVAFLKGVWEDWGRRTRVA